jgi:hypothetical protein
MFGSVCRAQQLNTDQVIDRIVQRESDEVNMLKQYDPIIETYLQDVRPDQLNGVVPTADHYFLGKALTSQGTVQLLTNEKKKAKHTEISWAGVKGLFEKGPVAGSFLQLIYVDPNGVTRQDYKFDYVRREFLGEVRCLVFDLTPLGKKGSGGFLGRVWVEDQGYTIVRFNGATVRGDNPKRFRLHVDSWRVNPAPGVWVPAYIYSLGSEGLPPHVVFAAETRFWGYKPVKDEDLSAAESQRAEGRETEDSALSRLETAGLLAPKGAVDKILFSVVNNLEVSSNLDIEPDIECRVLLTSTLESFPIGHTIVISRGLLDALPDEASLAMVLAHEIGHIMSANSLGDQWALREWNNLTFEDSGVDHFGFPINPAAEDAANAKAMELLNKSPYRDKLTNAVLFLQAVDSQKNVLPELISPHVASRTSLATRLVKSTQGTGQQIATLPRGSRIALDLWTDQVEITKRKPGAATSKAEGQPFQIAPSAPYLVYARNPQ